MHNRWKYLVRALIAFSPTILLLLAAMTGLIEKESNYFNGLGTAVSLIQGIVLFPFIVWIWVEFRRHPEKYPAPSWLIRALDIVPLGFIVFALAYFYLNEHGRF
jgi:hypothetical protein